MTTMLDAALAWVDRGFAVLPLLPGDKKPLSDLAPKGCYSATRDKAKVRRWWKAKPDANIGVAADHGLILLDVDIKYGGHLSLAELELEHGDLPLTLWENTGLHHCETVAADVRGKHIFLQMPDGFDGEPRGGKLRDYPGIDARVYGSYICAAPSLHESGVRYELGVPLETKVAIAPDWLVDLLAGMQHRDDDLDIPAIEDVYFDLDEWTAARMLKWTWERYQPNRREAVAHYCYRLFHACCSPEQALLYMRQAAIVLDSLSSHSEPYDTERWVQAKLKQVYRRGRTPKPSPWRMAQILKTSEGVNHV